MPLQSRLRIRSLPSPHHRGRGGSDVDLVVVHHISCPPGSLGTSDVEDLFLGRLDASKHPAYREVAGRALSAHFLVDRRGRVTQFVETDRAAFHAGESSWEGRARCNDFSVGIELIGDGSRPYTDRQYAALARLCRDLMRVHPGIAPERIVGHSDVATPPGRKSDPGPSFDWMRLRALLEGLTRPG